MSDSTTVYDHPIVTLHVNQLFYTLNFNSMDFMLSEILNMFDAFFSQKVRKANFIWDLIIVTWGNV